VGADGCGRRIDPNRLRDEGLDTGAGCTKTTKTFCPRSTRTALDIDRWGYAVIFYAQPRFTGDIDLFIRADVENARATYEALAAFGAPLQDIRVEDLAEPDNFFRFGREPHAIDILPSIAGVDFDAAWEKRVEDVVDPQSGLTAYLFLRRILLRRRLRRGGCRIWPMWKRCGRQKISASGECEPRNRRAASDLRIRNRRTLAKSDHRWAARTTSLFL
jgi:hypothetical protein